MYTISSVVSFFSISVLFYILFGVERKTKVDLLLIYFFISVSDINISNCLRVGVTWTSQHFYFLFNKFENTYTCRGNRTYPPILKTTRQYKFPLCLCPFKKAQYCKLLQFVNLNWTLISAHGLIQINC